MWIYCSDDTGALNVFENTDRNDIEGRTGKKLVTSLNVC